MYPYAAFPPADATKPSPLLFFVSFAACVISCPAQPALPTATRILVISTPGLEHPHYREQAVLPLPVWVGLSERDFSIETRIGAAAFSVVLTGKNGGEKLRRDKPRLRAELFVLGEAKPM